MNHRKHEKAFSAWLHRELPPAVSPDIAAVVLLLHETVDTFNAQIASASRFDCDDGEWASHSIVYSGDALFSIPRKIVDDSWQDALRLYERWFSHYLSSGARAPLLAAVEGVAVGFVDGDLILLRPAMPPEPVHAVFDYYDGERAGVAGFQGQPHAFRRGIDEASSYDGSYYRVKPLTEDEFGVVMTDWSIWTRWFAAHEAGSVGIETHPALPEGRQLHERIATAVAAAMSVDDHPRIVWGEFRRGADGQFEVQWNLVI